MAAAELVPACRALVELFAATAPPAAVTLPSPAPAASPPLAAASPQRGTAPASPPDLAAPAPAGPAATPLLPTGATAPPATPVMAMAAIIAGPPQSQAATLLPAPQVSPPNTAPMVANVPSASVAAASSQSPAAPEPPVPTAPVMAALAPPAPPVHVTAGTLPPYPAVQAHTARPELSPGPTAALMPTSAPVPAGAPAQFPDPGTHGAPQPREPPGAGAPAPSARMAAAPSMPAAAPAPSPGPAAPAEPFLPTPLPPTPAQPTSSQRQHAAVQPLTGPLLAMAPPQHAPAASTPALLPAPLPNLYTAPQQPYPASPCPVPPPPYPGANPSSTESRPHSLEHPAALSPSALLTPNGTTLYHQSIALPQPGTQAVQRGGGGWNMTPAFINTGQTENYCAPANANTLIPTQNNAEKELSLFPNSSGVPPVFGTDFSTQNETLNPENSPALIPKVENSQKCFNNFQLTDWHEVRRQICKEENLNPLAMPVLFSQQAGGPRTWQAIPHHEIKELRNAIKDSGICSPYFKQLLKSTLEGQTLTPNDCKNLASIILTDSQYMLWEFKWKRLLAGVLATYKQSTDADLRTLVISKLTGDHPDDQNDNQINLPKTALDDIKKMARKAFLQIQPAGSFEKAYNLISQELSEPFTTFVDRVIQAAERQCNDDIARPIMIRDIIENNANAECKKVIKTLGKERPTVPEMIDACNKMGGPQQVATIQANELGKALGEKIERALTAQTVQAAAQAAQAEAQDQKLTEILAALHLNSQQQGTTVAVTRAAVASGPRYFRKKPGHVMRNCPELKRGAQAPDRCPICKKGKHLAWQCRSRQDTSGKHSPKNSNASAQHHRVTQQVVAPQTPKVAKDNPHTFRSDVSAHHHRQSKASSDSRGRAQVGSGKTREAVAGVKACRRLPARQ
uniref:Uncharacterized protein n=1 Tax=Corvus moneduloides TaxID=1196302 RepID=A0A8U7N8B5_CORMO